MVGVECMKISHSAKEKFDTCGELYRLHYIENLRTTSIESPLIFGIALDEALNSILLGQSDGISEFEMAWYSQKLNNEDVKLQRNSNIRFFKNDLLFNLLTKDDIQFLKNTDHYPENKIIPNLKRITSNFQGLKQTFDCPEDLLFFNTACWLSMRRKGLLFLKTYREEIYPQFDKVLAVQRQINIDTYDEKDKIFGIVDFVATLKSNPKEAIIFDNKTSSKPYPKNSVEVSKQLPLYVWALHNEFNVSKAGYVVLNKNIEQKTSSTCSKCGASHESTRKKICDVNKCKGGIVTKELDGIDNSNVSWQLLVDNVDLDKTNDLLDQYGIVLDKIHEKQFDKNLNSCNNQFGRRCAFFDLCHGK